MRNLWGCWNHNQGGLADELLVAMMAQLVHRGPDDCGVYRDDSAALGFRRLSIIDLVSGQQPRSNENKTIWTVLNGEIYNFPALRRRLEAKGHVLRSHGDTETLVHLYEDEGTRMFSLLRGMFALAIWDARSRTLVLARDRLGQKPLIYRHDGSRLVFASELKALLALPESIVPCRLDPVALDHYLSYGYVPHPRTILAGTKTPTGPFRRLARRCARCRAVLAPRVEPPARPPERRTSRNCGRCSTPRPRADDIGSAARGISLRGHRLDDHRRFDATGVEPAREDLSDRFSRPPIR